MAAQEPDLVDKVKALVRDGEAANGYTGEAFAAALHGIASAAMDSGRYELGEALDTLIDFAGMR